MRPTRALRVAIPLLVVALAVVAAVFLRREKERPLPPEGVGPGSGTLLEGFTFDDLVGGRRRLSVRARLGKFDPEGGFHLEGVERLELDREGEAPLVLRADRGAGGGPEGKRVIRLDGGVEMRDEQAGLSVRLPSIEVDQAQGIARSLGEVEIEAPGWKGKASAAVYGLAKESTSELFRLEASTAEGATLVTGRVVVDRVAGTLRLDGGLEYVSPVDRVRADEAIAERDANGRMRRLIALGSVEGRAARESGAPIEWRASRADVAWDENGAVVSAILDGGARLEQAPSSLTAGKITAHAVGGGAFAVAAEGGVVWSGVWGGHPARMQSGTLDATLGAKGEILSGEARGGVRFDGKDAGGEGGRAIFAPGTAGASVLTLEAAGSSRARVRSGKTRVAADRIVATPRGDRLEADGRVEATLLPATSGASAAGSSLFDTRETVHFVAGHLDSREGGKHLRFRQAVRGWQGDRTLSADELDADIAADAVDARGRVTTRLPRRRGPAASDADYLQVSADALSYRGGEGTATFTGNTRSRLAEGWMESARLLVLLRRPEGGIREVRAFDEVRLEFAATDERGMPTPVTGTADRLVWDPDASTARLFGDKAPAQVRREGERGGTTTGRVLRYRLDTRAVEVESAAERAR